MQRAAVINVVGLTQRLIGDATPNLRAFLRDRQLALIEPPFPAVTCTAQATYLTGTLPAEHGIVANGWYDRVLAEHQFWKQSNHLVHGPKIWETIRKSEPDFTCAKLFWWFNMYSSADYTITPRPAYPADGRKVFDIITHPTDIREEIKQDLGPFPFSSFWGPIAGIKSTKWIANSAKWIEDKFWPSLSLVYLPHLDYNLQRHGPDLDKIEQDLRELDLILADLFTFYANRNIEVVVLSEYGITPVDQPVHLNRIFREKGWFCVKDELGLEIPDLGSSKVFAIADHQVAHVYIKNPDLYLEVQELLNSVPGVEHVLSKAQRHTTGLDHPRSGDIIVVADHRSWFTYYFWQKDDLAPDYARCVDIHRKIGYDPVELFFDPTIKRPKLTAALKMLKSVMGFRTLFDMIPLDATLVKGSHGRLPEDTADWPVIIGKFPQFNPGATIDPRQIAPLLIEHSLRGTGYDDLKSTFTRHGS